MTNQHKDITKTDNIANLFAAVIEAFDVPERVTPSIDIENTLYSYDKDQNLVPFSLSRCEYMRQPLDMLSSYNYNKIIFMGPARTGKSEALVKGTIAYCIKNGQDVMLMHLTEKMAINWAKTEFANMLRQCPKLRAQLTGSRRDVTNSLTVFKSLQKVRINHPSVNSLASITCRNVVATDYDRMPLDIGGEGSPFALLARRTQTYGSRAKAIAESSPGHPVVDFDELDTHQAPPAEGIASLYNSGTRHVYYVQCSHCKEYFWARPETIKWDDDLSLTPKERGKTAYVECDHCGGRHNQKHVDAWCAGINAKWVGAGQVIDSEGKITGKPIETSTCSYWLRAPICGFNTLERIVEEWSDALDDFKATGSDSKLKAIVNTALGDPYVPQRLNGLDDLSTLERFYGEFHNGEVPEDCRILFAAVDVQGGRNSRFDVNIFGRSADNITYLVDSFEIKTIDDKGIQPDTNMEDWKVLITAVMDYKARVIGTDKVMKVAYTVCDSGGLGETTTMAYAFYEYLQHPSFYPLGNQFYLVKGRSRVETLGGGMPSMVQEATREGVLLVNVEETKTDIARIVNTVVGLPGSFRVAKDIPASKLKQLYSEERNPLTGRWEKRNKKAPNELLDCFSYYLALFNYLKFDQYLVAGRYDGYACPPEIAPLDKNSNVFSINHVNNNANNYAEKVRYTREREEQIKAQIKSKQQSINNVNVSGRRGTRYR